MVPTSGERFMSHGFCFQVLETSSSSLSLSSLELSDTKVYAPHTQALLGTGAGDSARDPVAQGVPVRHNPYGAWCMVWGEG